MGSSLRGEGPVCLVGVVVCPPAAPPVQSFAIARPTNGRINAPRYHQLMPISCHFRDCKALLVWRLSHTNSAIASNWTFTFIYVNSRITNVVNYRRVSLYGTRIIECFLSVTYMNLDRIPYDRIHCYMQPAGNANTWSGGCSLHF